MSGEGLQETLRRMEQRLGAVSRLPVESMADQVRYREAVNAALDEQAWDAASAVRTLRDHGVGGALSAAIIEYRRALMAARERPGGSLWRVVGSQARRMLNEGQLSVLGQSRRIQLAQSASKEAALAVWQRRHSASQTLFNAQQYAKDIARWREACTVAVVDGAPVYDVDYQVRGAIREVMTEAQREDWAQVVAGQRLSAATGGVAAQPARAAPEGAGGVLSAEQASQVGHRVEPEPGGPDLG